MKCDASTLSLYYSLDLLDLRYRSISYANMTLDDEFEHVESPNSRTPPLVMLKHLY
jgi:hypothetical protein